MVERTPVFLGLLRPPKYFGLPISYFVMLAMGTVLPFLLADSFIFLAGGIVAYPVLWLLADREPHFFELLRVSNGMVRGTDHAA